MSSVFEHAWLSGLFTDPEMASLWSAESQMAHMLAMESAWSAALGFPEVGAKVAVFEPDIGEILEGTAQDGVPVPALVKQLKAAFGADGIHTGLTSQDVVDTALVLTILETVGLLEARLEKLIEAFDDLNGRFGARPLMGRTRMQAATEILVADRLSSWRFPHFNHRARLRDLRPRIGHLQIGVASGDRAALGADAFRLLAEMEAVMGLPAGAKAWHAMRDGVGEFASILSLITGSLGKFGQDIALMAQQGIDDAKLSGGGGSSAMPHKQNPILAELLVTLARFNATQIAGVHHALVHEQERSGTAWTLEWMILPQMAHATGRSLSAALSLTSSIESLGKG